MKSYGPSVSKGLSNNLSIKEDQATQILPEIVPLILGGLKKQMETRGGADRVDHILNKYGSAEVLDRIEDEISARAREENPDPRLGGLLGESGIQAANMMSNQFKMDSGLAAKLIPMLSPIILGALTSKRDSGGAGSSGIAALIDQDGDGSILDDVAGFLFKGAGGQTSQRKANPLGGLLGNLLGRRK